MFEVWGIHPESDDEWKEAEFITLREALEAVKKLPLIEWGIGYWQIRKNNHIVSEE